MSESDGFYSNDQQSSGSEDEIDTEEVAKLKPFLKTFLAVDDEIKELKAEIKPVNDRIKELNLKKKQLSKLIATIMKKLNIYNISPRSNDGTELANIARVETQRSKPTLKALNEALQVHFKGKTDELEKINELAMQQCSETKQTVRRLKKKK